MANDNDESAKFDLDARAAIAQANELKNSILAIGDAKNLNGLVQGLVRLAGPIAAVGAAFLAVKVAFDGALEGSKIENLNKQFDQLAASIGVNSVEMREGIEGAIGKTVDFEDALQSAKKAMSLLGENSGQIPAIFDAAKKAATLFGGEVTERFDQISNAIASGNTRKLRDIGITVDADKALRSYAKTLNVTVGALSEQGKQAAIAEAVLAKTEQRYKGVKSEQEGLEGSSKRFGQAWREVGDGVSAALNKMFGPAFTAALNYFSGLLDKVSDTLKDNFGTATEQASAKIRDLKDEYAEVNKEQEKFLQWEKENSKFIYTGTTSYNQRAEAMAKLTEEIKKQEEIISKAGAVPKKEGEDGGGGVDTEAATQQKNKFENDLLKIKEERLRAEMEIETNAEVYKDQQLERRVLVTAQYESQISAIKQQYINGDLASVEQRDALIEQIEQERAAKMSKMIQDEEQERIKAYDNQVKAAKNSSEGMSAAFAQGAAKAQASLKDYGAQGQVAFQSLNKNAAAAFRAFGDGSKSAGDAMKGFLLGSIADVAESQGQFLLASGIGTMNPVQIAQGGALIALAGLLRSQAGSAGGGIGDAGSGGGGGATGGSSSSLGGAPELQEQKKKSVTLQIMGNYFETEQTQRKMMDLIRQETDATDFKYQQIGG